MHFHFLDSQKIDEFGACPTRPKLSGSYSSHGAALAADIDVLRNGAGLETMWASTKDMSTRVFFQNHEKRHYPKMQFMYVQRIKFVVSVSIRFLFFGRGTGG